MNDSQFIRRGAQRDLKEGDIMWSDHMRLEERSLTLHQEIARRIRANPDLIIMVRRNVELWIEQSGEVPILIEWREILRKPIDQIIEEIVSPGEKARQLRQSSPFCGILTPKERWKIYESYEAGTYYQGRREHRR